MKALWVMLLAVALAGEPSVPPGFGSGDGSGPENAGTASADESLPPRQSAKGGQAERPEDPPPSSETPAEDPPPEDDPGDASPPIERFVPSEDVSADAAISFPVDI